MQLCFYHKSMYGYRIICDHSGDLSIFRDFLEDTIPTDNEEYLSWLISITEEETITNMLYIEKQGGLLYIRDKFEAKDDFKNALVLKISGITAVRLIREIENIKNTYNRPNEIIIMRENGQYLVKYATVHALSFIKSSNGSYYISTFWNYNKLAALLKFLLITSDFSFLEPWLNSSNTEIKVPCGHLTKKKRDIIIHYHTNPSIMTHTISIQTLLKVIAQYQQLIAIQPEELLLIQEPSYYSFMINPFEEIKIPKEI